MMLIVREEGSVPLPEDLAERFGIHEGSRIEWTLSENGLLTLRAAKPREEAIRMLRGSLKDTIKSGDGGLQGYLEWRENERRLDETY